MKKRIMIMMAAAVVLAAGCKKENPKPEGDNPEALGSAWVLNEGGWGANEASISRLDIENGAVKNGYFASCNGRGLGDVAQDLAEYGSKMWCVVWGSNTVEVIDKASGKSRQIDMGRRGPRYVAFDGGKAYVSCYTPASVVKIDTATLAIEGVCELSGLPPEDLCVAGGKIWVVNGYTNDASGNPMYDSTLAVVDLATFSEERKIVVGVNPTKVAKVSEGRVAVAYTGNYGETPGGLAIVGTDGVIQRQVGITTTNLDTKDGQIYLYSATYDASWHSTYKFYRVDSESGEATEILTGIAGNFSETYYPYAINVNQTTGDIYVSGAGYGTNGDIYCYSSSGSQKWKAEVGVLPSKVVVSD
ncbi:MAG: hypothetical protein IJL38_03350 [Bacteroidales bacterium]|nr:hypothetical protein [Bacteroidales bacterium]